ncbi:MAG: hypothetical protein WCK49_08770 [Myxococcaceae bacterium]
MNGSILHATGSDSGNAGCRSGGASTSSEGNDHYACSQGSGSASASCSERGASGSVASGSYGPFEPSNSTSHRFDRAVMGLIEKSENREAKELSLDELSVYILTTDFNSEEEYHRLVFRMNKLVDYFVDSTQELPSNFQTVAYDDPTNGGYDMAIMYVDDPSLAGKATVRLKQKVAAWLKTKIKPVPSLKN